MNDIGIWDLTPIYPGCDSKEFADDLKRVVDLAAQLTTQIASADSDVKTCIESYELMLDYLENIEAYSSACLSTDTGNPLYLNAVGKVEQASLAVSNIEVRFLGLLAARREEIETRTGEGGDLASYRFPLFELLEQQRHRMTSELEDLANNLARSGTDAFARLQEAMGSSISIDWGDGTTKTVVELRNEAYSADRAVRKRAFEKELELWKLFEVPYAAALNGIKGTTLTLDGMRGYASPLDRSLFQSRIDRPILDALISTIEANLPLFRTYLKEKARLLGLDGLAFYDLFAPVGDSHSTFTYEQSHAFIVKQFSEFSPEMGEFADRAFKQRWIDPFARKGKVGGAYDTIFPISKQSRILSNFDGTYNGLSTFAHELGHAYHDSVVMDKSNLKRTYPMTLAETASIFSEFLVFNGALKQSHAQERLSLVEHFVQDATQVCVDILSRFYFESEVFERRKDGELVPSELCEIMEDAQKRTYGDGLVVYHPYMWAAKGHYYSSDFSFYNYPYAFGQLFALGLYHKSLESDASFAEQYKTLLAATGSLSARDVASLVDVDLADPAFWQQGIDLIKTYIKELCDAPRG